MGTDCQVCGRPAAGEGTVEGARVPLCDRDSAYSSNFSFYQDFVDSMQEKAAKMRPSYSSPVPAGKQPGPFQSQRPSSGFGSASASGGELAGDYGKRIMQGRDRQGLSRKDLAQKLFIQEKQLEGFEQQKFKPDEKIVKKLEFALGIKLTESEE